MKRALPLFLAVFCLFLISNPSFAQTTDPGPDEAEDEAAAGRVVRVSFVEGDVSFQRAGTSDWAAAVENLPLFAGDQVYAGKDARVELQLGRGSYIRLSENTALTITDLRDDAAQFELPAGIAFIRVEQLEKAFQRFEIDTPNAALLLQQDGLYRINVRGDDDSELIVRRGAAEVSTEDGSFKVREGRRLLIDTSASGRLEVAYDTTQDDWDLWSATRDATINSQYTNVAPDYVTQYETTYSDFYGVSDLSNYGSWYDDPGYGHCWRPRVDNGWTPYRQGQWIWTRAGWTWISSEPWGWAPYHYGRWAWASNFGWVWVPGYGRSTNSYNNYQWRAYYRWRPALVGFFDAPSPRGHYVGWYPLAPGQRWHRPDGVRRDGDHSHLQYPTTRDGWRRPGQSPSIQPPQNGRGVTLLPVNGFNRSDRSPNRPVAPDTEMSNWIRRGARPGLPQIQPAPIASAPVMRDGQRNRLAIPSNEIIRRPVVTRNRPTNSEATANPPRERRLITPRAPVMSNEGDWRREKNPRNDDQRMKPPSMVRPAEGQNANPASEKPNGEREKGPKPRILPAERGDESNDKAERKARRGKEVTAPSSPDKGRGNDTTNDERKRPVYTPQPKQNDSANGDDTRVREGKARDEEQNRLRDEERARQRNEERQRQQQEEQSRQRDEERARQREERQRRSEEEGQRQQQEEHQRRNEEERARQRNEEQNRQREAERTRQQEEQKRQHDEERQRQREKPPTYNNLTPRSEPSREERRQDKPERRAEREQRRKS